MSMDPIRGIGGASENKIDNSQSKTQIETPKSKFFEESAKRLSGFDKHIISEEYGGWKRLKPTSQETKSDTTNKTNRISEKLMITKHRNINTKVNPKKKPPNINFDNLEKPEWKD